MDSRLVRQLRESVDGGRKIAYSVYEVNGTAVAKWRGCSRNGADHESRICGRLFAAGVHVPRPYGVVELPPSWYFLMERIDGSHITRLGEREQDEAWSQYRRELGKALDIGILPTDTGVHNALFDRSRGKLYLFDFEGWEEMRGEADKRTRDRMYSDLECRRVPRWDAV